MTSNKGLTRNITINLHGTSMPDVLQIESICHIMSSLMLHMGNCDLNHFLRLRVYVD